MQTESHKPSLNQPLYGVEDFPSTLEFYGIENKPWVTSLIHDIQSQFAEALLQRSERLGGTVVVHEHKIPGWTSGDVVKTLYALHIASSTSNINVCCVRGFRSTFDYVDSNMTIEHFLP